MYNSWLRPILCVYVDILGYVSAHCAIQQAATILVEEIFLELL